MSATVSKDIVQYPISAQYCQNWGIREALREVIANSLDAVDGDPTQIKLVYEHEHSQLVITNSGQSLKPQHLVIGEGEVKGGGNIGQFREGLKIALLVLARQGRRVSIDSQGFRVPAVYMADGPLGAQVMHLEIEQGHNKHKRGTTVRVSCTEEELESARQLFLALDPRYVGKYDPADKSSRLIDISAEGKGAIYVNGLLAELGSNQVGVYYLSGEAAKQAINRDRDKIRLSDVAHEVSNIIYRLPKVGLHKLLDALKVNKQAVEHNEGIIGYDKDPDILTYLELDPDKTARPNDAFSDRECEERGVTILRDSYPGLFWRTVERKIMTSNWLLRNLTLAEEKEARRRARARERQSNKKTTIYGAFVALDKSEIPEEQQLLLGRAIGIAEELKPQAGRYKYFVFADEGRGERAAGVCVRGQKAIGVQGHFLKYTQLHDLVAVILHEMNHMQDGQADDATRKFENLQDNLIGSLVDRLIDNKRLDKAQTIDIWQAPNSNKRYVRGEQGDPLAAKDLEDLISWFKKQGVRSTITPLQLQTLTKRRWSISEVQSHGRYAALSVKLSSVTADDGSPRGVRNTGLRIRQLSRSFSIQLCSYYGGELDYPDKTIDGVKGVWQKFFAGKEEKTKKGKKK